ncbi:hypothetical protein K0M31_018512 [Melipona bicolor]|uniref:Uncharacterized protein n=1 Tax=Melipona bicolor TaxID=60889 RepID=A0AA40G4H6_9HYME|nr:hypothetical protein K0M31_018512 [Melipona bicolor]
MPLKSSFFFSSIESAKLPPLLCEYFDFNSNVYGTRSVAFEVTAWLKEIINFIPIEDQAVSLQISPIFFDFEENEAAIVMHALCLKLDLKSSGDYQMSLKTEVVDTTEVLRLKTKLFLSYVH